MPQLCMLGVVCRFPKIGGLGLNRNQFTEITRPISTDLSVCADVMPSDIQYPSLTVRATIDSGLSPKLLGFNDMG